MTSLRISCYGERSACQEDEFYSTPTLKRSVMSAPDPRLPARMRDYEVHAGLGNPDLQRPALPY